MRKKSEDKEYIVPEKLLRRMQDAILYPSKEKAICLLQELGMGNFYSKLQVAPDRQAIWNAGFDDGVIATQERFEKKIRALLAECGKT